MGKIFNLIPNRFRIIMKGFVCLSCLHVFESRINEVLERQCSRCRWRFVIDAGKLETAVLSTKEWLDANKSPFPFAPLYLPKALQDTINVLLEARPPIAYGVISFQRVLWIAQEFNPSTESFRDCIIRLGNELWEAYHPSK